MGMLGGGSAGGGFSRSPAPRPNQRQQGGGGFGGAQQQGASLAGGGGGWGAGGGGGQIGGGSRNYGAGAGGGNQQSQTDMRYTGSNNATAGDQSKFDQSKQDYWQQHWEAQPGGQASAEARGKGWFNFMDNPAGTENMSPLYDQYGVYGWQSY